MDEDLPPEPAMNLSNRLNPNNIHYDKELATRCGLSKIFKMACDLVGDFQACVAGPGRGVVCVVDLLRLAHTDATHPTNSQPSATQPPAVAGTSA